MHGDFTRDSFDPIKNYSRVMMQQGRVALDADWNEQTSILLRQMRTLARDVFGPYAGPREDLGFRVIWDKDDLATLPFNIELTRRQQIEAALDGGDALICPGRYYVDGLLVENHAPILFSEQDAYRSSSKKLKELVSTTPPAGVLLYLDVWERHLTYLWDDSMREVALGGPDTCSRAEVFWQLRVLVQKEFGRMFDCSAISGLERKEYGQLAARTDPGSQSEDLCVIAPESRYRGLENQLYRVEIHRGGTADQATFVWSRENGSVVFPIRKLNGKDGTLTLYSLGRDRRSTLDSGNWVEIIDEETAAADDGRSILARVEKPPNREDLTVTLTLVAPGNVSLPNYDEKHSKRPMLRRWDYDRPILNPAPAGYDGAISIARESAGGTNRWIDLENGVQIRFSENGEYRPGDYWLVPARTATGKIDFPELPPRGPRHHYAPILVTRPQYGPYGGREVQDCRKWFERPVRQSDLKYPYPYGHGLGFGYDF